MSFLDGNLDELLADADLPLIERQALMVVRDSLYSWKDSQERRGVFQQPLPDGPAFGDMIFRADGHSEDPAVELSLAS